MSSSTIDGRASDLAAGSRRRPPQRAAQRWAVRAIALVAGSVAVAAEGRPTATPVVDGIWRFAFAVVVVVAASRCRRWPLFVLAGGAAVLPSGWPQLAGLAALVLAFVDLGRHRAHRVIGALVGGLAVQALLRLPTSWPARSSAAVAAAGAAVVCVSAWGLASRRSRRRIVVVAVVGGGVVLAWTAVAALGALGARDDTARGLERLRGAVAAARDGDSERAGALFAAASVAFDDAHGGLAAWYATPARWIPGVGPQVGAARAATHEAARLTATASSVAEDVPVEEITLVDGQVDLGLVRSMQGPLVEAVSVVSGAEARLAALDSAWLVPPLVDRLDEMRAELSTTGRATSIAADTVDVLPSLLGGEGSRRYIVVFTTPAETRGAGGFIGAIGEITAVDGVVELTRTDTAGELNRTDRPYGLARAPSSYTTLFGGYDVGRWIQNATASPDLGEVADVLTELYPQVPDGAPVDGVILADPYALAAILRVTGPVMVDGLAEPLTADNAPSLLLREQYFRFDPSSTEVTAGTQERYDFLEAAARATFEALTTRTTTPAPRELVDIFESVVAQRRLAAVSVDGAEQAFLQRNGLAGSIPAARGGDLISIVQANAGGNKLDSYLHRALDYEATFDPATGAVAATATVRLTNDPPDGPLPLEVGGNLSGLPAGTNKTVLTIYSPLDVVGASADGTALPVGGGRHLGLRAHTAVVAIPPGQTVTCTFRLEGAVEPGEYRLQVVRQPVANPDALSVTVTGARPARPTRVSGSAGATADADTARLVVDQQVADEEVVVRFGVGGTP